MRKQDKLGINITIPKENLPSNVPATQAEIDEVFDMIAKEGGPVMADMIKAVREDRNPFQEFHDKDNK